MAIPIGGCRIARYDLDYFLAQQWDQSHQSWQDTPLAQWAGEQRNGDGIDIIPPKDEPVFI